MASRPPHSHATTRVIVWVVAAIAGKASASTDAGGDGCAWYSARPSLCGCCDDEDFNASSCAECAAAAPFAAESLEEALAAFPGKTTRLLLGGRGLRGAVPGDLAARFPGLEEADLSQNDLVGAVPEGLWACRHLRRLNLSGNGMEGPLGDGVGQATELTHVDISRNKLSGPLPASIGNWTKIQYVRFSMNGLSGTIPDTVRYWREVESVWLDANELSGEILGALGDWKNVEDMLLSHNKLSGSIPEQLGNWHKIRRVWLHENELSGELPKALGNWNDVEEVRLNDNKLNGSIPDELGNWRKVKKVALGDNKLSGSIPKAVANWSNLEGIQINDNNFEGTVPDEVGAWRKVRYVWLQRNRFSGHIPKAVGEWSAVERFYLHQNFFTGSIPDEVGNLRKAKDLFLYNNKLSGNIPRALGNCTDLGRIYILNNQLTGPLPEELGNLRKLTAFYFYDNQLLGPIPKAYGSWSELVRFHGSNNQLTGPLPEEFGNWTKIDTLRLTGNRISGTLSPAFGSWSKLEQLYLDENELSGRLPEEVGNWRNIEKIKLDHNKFNGPIPRAVGAWSEVVHLNFEENQFTGGVPEEVGQWRKATKIKLARNMLTGPLPKAVGNWSMLLDLDLSYNQLSGPLPLEIGQWGKAIEIRLFENRFTGAIPKEMGKWASVTHVQMGDNHFTGPIPEELGNLAKLTDFSIERCKLSGPLPKSIGKLDKVESFSIYDNNISGALPEEIGQMISMRKFSIKNNSFTGKVPQGVANWSQLTAFRVHRNMLTELPEDLQKVSTLEELSLHTNKFTRLPNMSGLGKIRKLNLLSNTIREVGLLPPMLQVLGFQYNNLTSVPEAIYELQHLEVLTLADNNIARWPPRGVLRNKMVVEGGTRIWCNKHPIEPRFAFLMLRRLDASRNPLATGVRDFLNSLAYLHDLSDLTCRSCDLRGPLRTEVMLSLADDQAHTGDKECEGMVSADHGFRGLQNLDLGDNAIEEVQARPSASLSFADFSKNALTGLHGSWFNLERGNRLLQLKIYGNERLRAEVSPPEGRCSALGAENLTANPDAYEKHDGGYECTSLCPGPMTTYSADADLDLFAMCRCLPGYAGKGRDCSLCPADSYSSWGANDSNALVRHCQPCPAHSDTGGATGVEAIAACKCPIGTYLDAGSAACVRCKQWPFRTTTAAGAQQPSLCGCNASYSGLKENEDVCGCDDGRHMNHATLACERCTNAELCQWGLELQKSLQPPLVKPGFWAEPVAELSTFSSNSIWRCSSSSACHEGGVCAAGREGRACSLCEAGTHGGPDGPCESCGSELSREERRWLLALAALAFVPVTICIHNGLVGDGASISFFLLFRAVRGSLKQMVKHVQTVTVIGNFQVSWPPLAKFFFTILERFSITVPTLLGIGCLQEQTSAALEMGAKWCIPLVFAGTAFLAIPVSRLLSWALQALTRCCPGTRVGKVLSACNVTMRPDDVMRVLLFCVTLFWSTLVANSFEMVTCNPSPNGRFTVAKYPHIECTLRNSEFVWLALHSAFFAFLYLVIPIRFLIRAWNKSAASLALTARADRGWYGFLFEDFRDGHLLWPIIIMGKDALFVIIPAALPGQGAAQLLLTAAIQAAHICLVMENVPFRDRSNSLLEAWNGATAAALCVYSVGMGYEKTAGMEDVEALFQDGAEDALYRGRAIGMVVVQAIAICVPACFLLFQILCALPFTQRHLPRCVLPYSPAEYQQWLDEFIAEAGIEEAHMAAVLKNADDADIYAFRSFIEHTSASMGTELSKKSMSSLVRRAADFVKTYSSLRSRSNLPEHQEEVGLTLGRSAEMIGEEGDLEEVAEQEDNHFMEHVDNDMGQEEDFKDVEANAAGSEDTGAVAAIKVSL